MKLKQIAVNKGLLIPLGIYTFIFLIYINTVPFLDGNIDFLKSYDFYSGGTGELFRNWGSIHPPLKEVFSLIFFRIAGINPISYNLTGYFTGFAGIVAMYSFTARVFGSKTAAVAALLLSLDPLFLSTGIFGLTDFLLTNIVIVGFYYLAENNLLGFSLAAAFAYLAKETGILFYISGITGILIYYLSGGIRKSFRKSDLLTLLFLLIPVLTYFLWGKYLNMNGKGLWSDWNFSSVSDKGTVYTIYHNLVSGEFLNSYAYQNWLQLLVLNFNWLYWTASSAGIIYITLKSGILKKVIPQKKYLPVFVLMLFSFLYFLMVLSFQTYTIPRYSLPIHILMITLFSAVMTKVVAGRILTYLSAALFLILIPLSLLSSSDPLTRKLWATTKVAGETFYGMNNYLAGNDGLTYNLQYLNLAKKRSQYLKHGADINFSSYCRWFFLDPRNDIKTADIFFLRDDIFKECGVR